MSGKSPIASILLLVVFAGALVSPSPAEANEQGNLRFTVMVQEFENRSGWKGNVRLGQSWAAILTSALHENGNFIVVGQSNMREAAMDEQAFGATGATTQGKKTAQRGQLSPAQLLVQGSITHFAEGSAGKGGGVNLGPFRVGSKKVKTEIYATVQMVDSSTGQVVAARNFEGSTLEKGLDLGAKVDGDGATYSTQEEANVVKTMKVAINDVVAWMVEQLPSFPWRGSVLSVQDDLIFINRGSREGVATGEVFVVGESEVLRDPDTGEVLYEKVTERARLRADQVEEKVSICSVVSGDGSLLAEGMGVRRAQKAMPKASTVEDAGEEAVVEGGR